MRKMIKHPAIADIEGEGLDDDRFFVHLKKGWDWCYDPHNVTRSKSFGSVAEAKEALKYIKKVEVL